MWELLEGHKNPAPLLWSWFGAVKMERKPLTYEESHRLLKYHTHSLVKPSSYFYEPLQLPPEDAEEPTQSKNNDDKADTPSSVESPAGSKSRKGVKRQRKPKVNAAAAASNANQIPNQMPNQIQNQAISPMLNQQLNQQMSQQQFNNNQGQQQMGNMMPNNMGMMNQMGLDMGQNMNQNQMQMGQIGINQMQTNNPGNMGQMNPMQYQQQQQQMNINQSNINMMGQQNQQWGYNQQIQNQQTQPGQTNQQFYNQTGVGGMNPANPQSMLNIFLFLKMKLTNLPFYFSQPICRTTTAQSIQASSQ